MAVGRFAPSPTGPLHYGSLIAALGSWLFARSSGGEWLLRIDDLDSPRVVPGMADDIMRTLELLGLHWDRTPVWQSRRSVAYALALHRLSCDSFVYPCSCTRSEIARIATAPHGEEEVAYPGICRNGMQSAGRSCSLRVKVFDDEISFEDLLLGPVSQRLPDVCGDFVVRRADGLFAYHLATVVDDSDSGVDQIVRGADLVSSTPRQIHLQSLLGYEHPAYAHLPLVIASTGGKLSKRDSAVSLSLAADLKRDAGGLLVSALVFLGQKVDGIDTSAPPEEILAVALLRFDPTLIPLSSRPFQENE